jgi:hypothetical protein
VAKRLAAITRDQEFFDAILVALEEIRDTLHRIEAGKHPGDGIACEECGKQFKNERALRGHMLVHSRG